MVSGRYLRGDKLVGGLEFNLETFSSFSLLPLFQIWLLRTDKSFLFWSVGYTLLFFSPEFTDCLGIFQLYYLRSICFHAESRACWPHSGLCRLSDWRPPLLTGCCPKTNLSSCPMGLSNRVAFCCKANLKKTRQRVRVPPRHTQKLQSFTTEL